MTILMYDSTQGNSPPANSPAVAGYMDGRFNDFAQIVADHPNAHHLSITVLGGDADALDWEPGNANPNPAGWAQQQRNRGRFRPCLYADLSDMRGHILPSLGALPPPGPGRPVRIWSAHPTGVEHLCGPGTCGQLPIDADATQFWFDSISGPFHGVGNVDVNICRDDFFGGTVTPPPPPTTLEEIMGIAIGDLGGIPHVFVTDKDNNVFYTYQPQDTNTPGPDRAWKGGISGKQIAALQFFAPAPK